MTDKPLKNVSASVRQRLLNQAKQDRRPFNELLQYYGMERFLYRLSQSPHAGRFVLKGGLMLRVWNVSQSRPTMDIDMLGRTSNEPSQILRQMQEMLAVVVEPDGMVFDVASLQTEPITKDADYQGIRVRCLGYLDTARVNIQLDLGFGDAVFPPPETALLPTLLDYPAPQLLCYSRESVIAEKFEAMLSRGELNSRMKDFYDVWLLSEQFDFDDAKLTEAIRRTLEHRGTIASEPILAFSEEFAALKQVQWTAFCKRLGQERTPSEFVQVVKAIEEFLAPVVLALSNQKSIISEVKPLKSVYKSYMGILFIIDDALGKNKKSVTSYAQRNAIKNKVIGKSFHYPDNCSFSPELSPDLIDEISDYSEFKRKVIDTGEYYHYEYENRLYGFKRNDITTSLREFDYVFVVVRDTALIRELKRDYKNQAVAVYIHTDQSIVREVLSGYSSTEIDFKNVHDEYVSNSALYDHVLINNNYEDNKKFYNLFDKIIEKQHEEKPNELRLVSGERFELIDQLVGSKEKIRNKLTNYENNVFLMMKFRDNNKELSDFIKNQLRLHKLNCIRADDNEWQITGDTYNPIAVLYCCKYGIALFDDPEEGNTFSPNVAYELGMMHLQKKDCLILKSNKLPNNFFDLIAQLHSIYSEKGDFQSHIMTWMEKIGRI